MRKLIVAYAIPMWLLAAVPVLAAPAPSLLVLPLDWVDTSGEMPSHKEKHIERLMRLGQYLSRSLAQAGIYTVIDPAPIEADIGHARATQPLDACNGCERDLARLLHADRVLVGEVDKVSTLIGSLRLSIIDVASGVPVFARVLSFRGDDDTAWEHAIQFFVRDLAATSLRER
jgi:Protein of unknown function (DUF2380)